MCSKPSRLLDCPVEVQLVILSFLPKEDLVFMCLMNKHLRNITQPLLHKELDISCPPGNPTPLILIIRTLLERPDLADEVQDLRLDGYAFPPRRVDCMPITPVISLTLKGNMKKAIDFMINSGLQFADVWAADFEKGQIDSVVTLLLALLPKVRKIFFGEDFCVELHFIRLLLDSQRRIKPNSKLHKFEHLRHVTVRNEMATHYHHHLDFADSFRSFFHLSGLETLTISGDFPENLSRRQLMTFAPMMRLGHLGLTRIGEAELEQILPLGPNLKSLRYTYTWHPRNVDFHAQTLTLNLNTLRNSLECHRRQLERLNIVATDDTRVRDHDVIWPLGLQGGPLNLHDFSSLRTLSVPWMFLTGPSKGDHTLALRYSVPKTVVTLCLTEDLHRQMYWAWNENDIKNMVTDYLHYVKTAKTALRMMCMTGQLFVRIWSREEEAETQKLAHSANVGFGISKLTPTECHEKLVVLERKRRFGKMPEKTYKREMNRLIRDSA
ncbi:hypothetical protein IL306_011150 [Fusarium sp. DS 682]|nr:hypothetical protein IL306_011150 [Fusarium sp. DS 682]